MKKQNIITLLSFIILNYNVHAIDKYVTDNVDVYLRRGPGAQYAFSNSVKTGEKVTELEKSADGKYTKIEIGDGIMAWIETNKLNEKPSYKERYLALKAQLAEYKNKADNTDQLQQNTIDDYAKKLQSAEKLIENFQNKNNELEKQIQEQNKQIEFMLNQDGKMNQDDVGEQVDRKRRNLFVTWFTYGGLVAGGGFILGLILPNILSGRRRRDNWLR